MPAPASRPPPPTYPPPLTLRSLLALPASWSLSTTFLVSFGAALLLKTALDKVFDPSRHRSSRTMASATSLLSNKDTLNTDTNATIRSYESMCVPPPPLFLRERGERKSN